jgi:hypothetical protein
MLARSSLKIRVVAFGAWLNFVLGVQRLRNAKEKATDRVDGRAAAAAFMPWLRAARDSRARQVRESVATLEEQTTGVNRSLNATQDELVQQRAMLAVQQGEMQELIEDTVMSHTEQLLKSFAAEVSEKTEVVRVSVDAQLLANAEVLARSRLEHATRQASKRVSEMRVADVFTSWLACSRSLQTRRIVEQIEALEDVVESHKAEAGAIFGALNGYVETSIGGLQNEKLVTEQCPVDSSTPAMQARKELETDPHDTKHESFPGPQVDLASIMHDHSELGESLIELQEHLGDSLALDCDREMESQAHEESLLLLQQQLSEVMELLRDHGEQADAHTAKVAALCGSLQTVQRQAEVTATELQESIAAQLVQQASVKVLESQQEHTMDKLNAAVDSITKLLRATQNSDRSEQVTSLQSHVKTLEQEFSTMKASMLEVLSFNHNAIAQAGTAAWEAHIERVEKSEHTIVKVWQWMEDLQEDRDAVILPLLQRLAKAEEHLDAQVQQHTAILNAPAHDHVQGQELTIANAGGSRELSEGVPPPRLPQQTPLRDAGTTRKDGSPVWTPAQTPAQMHSRSTVSGPMRTTTQTDEQRV